MHDLVPIEVWDRVPSEAEIKKIVTNIDRKFFDLFLELGMPRKIIEQHRKGRSVTFQFRMKTLLQYWIDSDKATATICRLLTAMTVWQMDWHTTAHIWSA